MKIAMSDIATARLNGQLTADGWDGYSIGDGTLTIVDTAKQVTLVIEHHLDKIHSWTATDSLDPANDGTSISGTYLEDVPCSDVVLEWILSDDYTGDVEYR